jgi:hypothetical protein
MAAEQLKEEKKYYIITYLELADLTQAARVIRNSTGKEIYRGQINTEHFKEEEEEGKGPAKELWNQRPIIALDPNATRQEMTAAINNDKNQVGDIIELQADNQQGTEFYIIVEIEGGKQAVKIWDYDQKNIRGLTEIYDII